MVVAVAGVLIVVDSCCPEQGGIVAVEPVVVIGSLIRLFIILPVELGGGAGRNLGCDFRSRNLETKPAGVLAAGIALTGAAAVMLFGLEVHWFLAALAALVSLAAVWTFLNSHAFNSVAQDYIAARHLFRLAACRRVGPNSCGCVTMRG